VPYRCIRRGFTPPNASYLSPFIYFSPLKSLLSESLEDDELQREVLANALRNRGYEVIEAADGQEALEKTEGTVDAVVTDGNMPELGGHELISQLADRRWTVPIMFYSGKSLDRERVADYRGIVVYQDKGKSDLNLDETVDRIVALIEGKGNV